LRFNPHPGVTPPDTPEFQVEIIVTLGATVSASAWDTVKDHIAELLDEAIDGGVVEVLNWELDEISGPGVTEAEQG